MEVTCANEGADILVGDLPYIFDRFFRARPETRDDVILEVIRKAANPMTDAQLAPAARVLAELRENADLVGEYNQALAGCARSFFEGQRAAAQAALDEMTSITQGARQPRELTDLAELQRKFGAIAFRHAVEQVKVMVEAAADVSNLTLELTRGSLRNLMLTAGEETAGSQSPEAASKESARSKLQFGDGSAYRFEITGSQADERVGSFETVPVNT